jgi:5'-nucleotidase
MSSSKGWGTAWGIVITNDDGIDAVGLAALVDAGRQFGEPIVVAPARPHSQCSHSVSTDRIIVRELRPRWFVVEGTPVDCVRIAIEHLAPSARWIFSGINHGGNLGGDVLVSGTVAAAREAALRGRLAIAVSQYRRADVPDCWMTSGQRAQVAIKEIMRERQQSGSFWNVNLPAVPSDRVPTVVSCPLDPHPLPIAYRPEENGFRYVSTYHQRPRLAGHDVDCCFRGAITVSQLTCSG